MANIVSRAKVKLHGPEHTLTKSLEQRCGRLQSIYNALPEDYRKKLENENL